MTRTKRFFLAITVISLAFMIPSLGAADDLCDIDSVVILGTNSVQIGREAGVTGDVVANDASLEAVLDEGAELAVDTGAMLVGDASGDTVDLDRNSSVSGVVRYNELFKHSQVTVTEETPLALPVFADLPLFQEADVRPECDDVFVGPGVTVLGDEDPRETCYGDITIDEGGTVVFSGGGAFDVRSITAVDNQPGQCGVTPCRSIEFDAPTSLRVEGKFDSERDGFVGPQNGSGIFASDIVIYSSSINGMTGDLLDVPAAVEIGRDSTVEANIYAPEGKIILGQGTDATGAFLARDVNVHKSSTVNLDSAFSNQPPTADPQERFTQGAASIVITLTGNDPEGQDLIFDILSGPDPLKGSLGQINVINPPPVGRCSVSNLSCDPTEPEPNPDCVDANDVCETLADPPAASATVTYTPVDPGANLEDAFTFKVTDACGAMGTAVVDINPGGDAGTVPCPVIPVEARNVGAGSTPGVAVAITLDAVGPECGAELVYKITSLPVGAALSDSGGNAIENVPYTLSDELVVFVSGSEGSFSFGYSAEDTTGPNTGSDTATVSVDVNPQAELAVDQSVTTSVNSPVVVTLSSNPGGTGGGPLGPVSMPLAPQPLFSGGAGIETDGAAIAGTVSDADDDGFGDGKDDLPGPAPVLISAGVDVNLGAGGGSTITWTLNGVTFDDGGTANGTFEFDGTTQTATDWNVTTSDFTAAGLGPFTYTPANSTFSKGNFGDPLDYLQFSSIAGFGPNSNSRQFRFTPDVLLSNAGGNVTLDTTTALNNSGSTECINCSPFRVITGGSLSAPEPPNIVGVKRVQIEWDITGLLNTPLEDIESATVTLITEKGSVDSLDTFWFVASADGNGLLDESDFETPVSQLPSADCVQQETCLVMPVPVGAQTGDEGTFSFNVGTELKAAITAGFDYFSIQGQVDEALAGQGFQRGLQIHSTATGNLSLGKEPQLEVTIVAPAVPLTYTVLAPLPSNGTLNDLQGNPVSAGQIFNEVTDLVYTPNTGYTGTDTVFYSVQEGAVIDNASIAILVALGDCVDNSIFCNDGRALFVGQGPVAGASTDEPLFVAPSALTVEVSGPGAVSSSRRQVGDESFVGLVCAGGGYCGADFEDGSTVVLYARPIEAGSEFAGWGGDCSGTSPVAVVAAGDGVHCTATFIRSDDN